MKIKKVIERNNTSEMKKANSENRFHSSLQQREFIHSEMGIPSNFSTRDLILGRKSQLPPIPQRKRRKQAKQKSEVEPIRVS